MTEFEIYCANCKKRFIINNEYFTELVKLIEFSTEEIASTLHEQEIPAIYKSHCHVTEILQQLMRCCAKPEIYFSPVKSEDEINRIIEECKKKRNEEIRKKGSEN